MKAPWVPALKVILLVLAAVLTGCQGQFSWPWEKEVPAKKVFGEVRTVGLYQTVVLTGRGDLVFSAEVPSDQVWIRSAARPDARVVTGNAFGKLILDSGPGDDYPTGSLEFRISSRNAISELRLEGWGDIVTKDTLKSDGLTIRQSGLGRMEMSLDTPAVEIHQTGVNQMVLRGRADLQKVYTDGLGWLNGENLRGAKVEAHCYGMGEVRVNASESFRVWAVGPVHVFYTGKPPVTEVYTEPSSTGGLPRILAQDQYPAQGKPGSTLSP